MHTDRCGNTRRQKCCAKGSGKEVKIQEFMYYVLLLLLFFYYYYRCRKFIRSKSEDIACVFMTKAR